jgi:hypothetical protein
MPMLHHRPTRALNPISTMLATTQVAKPARRLRDHLDLPQQREDPAGHLERADQLTFHH